MAQRKKPPEKALVSETILAIEGTKYRDHADLLYSMHELSRLISVRVDKDLASHQLTHAQWWALMHIYEHGEGQTQSELADILQMGRAATGKLLERLEAKRWIERRTDESDTRVRRVYLQPEVLPIFRLMTAEGRMLFDIYLEGISTTEAARLLAGLRKIKANAERREAEES